MDDTRDGSYAGSQTRASWVIQALYALPEEDDVKEIQASHIALSGESSTVQEEVGNYLDNLAKAKSRDDERLIFVKNNSLCECKDCSKTNDDTKESNLTKLIRNH